MNFPTRLIFTLGTLLSVTACLATPATPAVVALAAGDTLLVAAAPEDDALALKMAALEALMNAPPERALPMVERILKSSQDERLKHRSLFILSQIELPQARTLLVDTAQNATPGLRREAIRTIGISGDPAALAALQPIYRDGDRDTRRSVLQAYLIADAGQQVYEVARAADTEEDFEDAVRVLGAMGEIDLLRQLKDRASTSTGLIRAYAVAEDLDSLTELARDATDPEIRGHAMQAIGIVGGPEAAAVLISLYRSSTDDALREAVMHGLMVADEEEALLTLFNESTDDREKRRLLRTLVNMDSDAALDLIDSTLSGED